MLRQYMHYMYIISACYIVICIMVLTKSSQRNLRARFSLSVLSLAVKLSGKNKLNQFTDL